ncbi:related to UDP-glucose 4-epimerase [Cephalotrichum gorgonifer]|uniref:Related to UDP-glucose 4-epimerase n=1 Tax=Cephalotrichum gorgonifer TaxID=2041049 RepID=A0AAE8SU81_9PEZI|nr:related to UDP-glucose 4-epimerase [Cephalotrichum gorgonifer]
MDIHTQARPHTLSRINAFSSADDPPATSSTHNLAGIEGFSSSSSSSSTPAASPSSEPDSFIKTADVSPLIHPRDPQSDHDQLDMMDSYRESQASSSTSTLSLGSDSPATTPGSGSENGDHRGGLADMADLHLDAEAHSPFSQRYILVVGGLGFIGSHTSLELLKNGYNVIMVDNLSNSYPGVLTAIKHLAAKECQRRGRVMPAVRFHDIDYQSPAMQFLLDSYSEPVSPPRAAAGPNGEAEAEGRQRVTYRSQIAGVIHFAAFKSVVESISNPLDYYDNNVCGLVQLLRQLSKYNIRNFVFSSSATVYGSKATVGKLLREEDIIHHEESTTDERGNEVKVEPTMVGLTCPYARTKYFAEAILADVAASDPKWRIVSLRYFNPIGCDPSGLIGESPRNTPTNLFPVIAQVLTGQRAQLDVFGRDWDTADGTPVRDFIHVSDIARGHIAALDGAPCDAPFRTYNLGSGTGTTVHEAVKSLEQASGKAIGINWAGRRPGDVGFCVASNERARAELGWTPRESIAKCARDLWNYVRKQDTKNYS